MVCWRYLSTELGAPQLSEFWLSTRSYILVLPLWPFMTGSNKSWWDHVAWKLASPHSPTLLQIAVSWLLPTPLHFFRSLSVQSSCGFHSETVTAFVPYRMRQTDRHSFNNFINFKLLISTTIKFCAVCAVGWRYCLLLQLILWVLKTKLSFCVDNKTWHLWRLYWFQSQALGLYHTRFHNLVTLVSKSNLICRFLPHTSNHL